VLFLGPLTLHYLDGIFSIYKGAWIKEKYFLSTYVDPCIIVILSTNKK